MALKIIGVSQSLCTIRPLLVLAEKGIDDFELVGVDFTTGEHKRPPFTDKQPFGVIPVLQDGNFTLFESRAISRYLAVKFQSKGTSLVPEVGDLKGWALFEQWVSVEVANFSSFSDAILTQKLFNRMKGLGSDEAVTKYNLGVIEPKLDVLDQILAKQEYLGGQTFSLVDIFYMPSVNFLFRAGEGRLFTDRPNLNAWWEKVTSRDSWKKVTQS